MKLIQTKEYLLLIDEEAEISKTGTLIYENDTNLLNITGVDYEPQGVDSKIIAYYPLTEEAKELDLPLLPNPFKNEVSYNKDAIIEAFYTDYREWKNRYQDYIDVDFNDWFNNKIEGKQEFISDKQFSLEDMKKAFKAGEEYTATEFLSERSPNLEQYIQSLSTQQLPLSFEPEYNICIVCGNQKLLCQNQPICKEDGEYFELKTITNSEGREEICGTYKF